MSSTSSCWWQRCKKRWTRWCYFFTSCAKLRCLGANIIHFHTYFWPFVNLFQLFYALFCQYYWGKNCTCANVYTLCMSDWWSSGGHFYRTFVMSQLSLWLLREILNNHKNNRDLDHHLPPNLYRDMTNSSSFAHASEVNTIKTSNLRRSIISYSAGFRRPALSAALFFKEENVLQKCMFLLSGQEID